MLSTYSYSSLETFTRCPQKFKFQYIDKLKIEEGVYANLYLGNAVHRVLKKLYKHGFDGILISLEDTIKLYEDEWNKLDKNTIEVNSEYYTVDDYIRLGREMLERYYQKFQPFRDGSLIGAELLINFELPQTGFKFKCYIDRIAKQPDGKVEIWDYKTGQNILRPTDKRFIFQMGLYQLAVMSRFNDYQNIELVMYFLRQEETVRYKMTPEELDLLTIEFRNLVNAIINAERVNSFSAKEGNHCQWCEYQNLCPAKRHKKMLDESQSDEDLLFTPEQLKEKANTYLDTHLEHTKIKQKLDEQKEELKDIARQTGLKVLEGEKGKVTISLSNKESFVTKTQNEDAYLKLIMLCRDLELMDYFIPNTGSILKDYQRGLLSDEKYKQLEEFISINEKGSIRVKLAYKSDEADDENIV